MDREAWCATLHGVPNSRTLLSDYDFLLFCLEGWVRIIKCDLFIENGIVNGMVASFCLKKKPVLLLCMVYCYAFRFNP